MKTHFRHGGAVVETALLFHLEDDVLKHFAFVLIQMELFFDQLVSL